MVPLAEPAPSPDGEIARRIAARGGDAAASEAELCRRFLNRARLYGLKHLRFDVTAAEDLAQQVMVVVLEALRAGRVEDLDRIDRFMLGTCRNVAHSMRRQEKRVVETGKRLSAEMTRPIVPPWELVVTRGVADCLSQLPARETRLLYLLFQEGATAAEAAESLGTTAGNVRVLHHRAIARLRECVERSKRGVVRMTESGTCREPLSSGQILDYLSGELGRSDEAEEERVESHLFRCDVCFSEAERFAGLLASISAAIPPVLSPSRFAVLEREGRVGEINPMRPGQKADVFYPESGRLLVHRLGGTDLSRAERIDVDVASSSGEVLWHLEGVPFDPSRGEVLVACKRHFADLFPADIVFSVEVVSGERREPVGRYTVHHRLA